MSITLNDLMKARAKLGTEKEHKTFKELEQGETAKAGIKLDTRVHNDNMVTIKSGQRGGKSLALATEYAEKIVKKEPNYSQVVKSVGVIKDEPVLITKIHKPLGFINKSNMIRFVVPTVAGICLGSMLQAGFGSGVVFMLVFGVLGVAGAVMSS